MRLRRQLPFAIMAADPALLAAALRPVSADHATSMPRVGTLLEVTREIEIPMYHVSAALGRGIVRPHVSLHHCICAFMASNLLWMLNMNFREHLCLHGIEPFSVPSWHRAMSQAKRKGAKQARQDHSPAAHRQLAGGADSDR